MRPTTTISLELEDKIRDLSTRLKESESTLNAIRQGEVDALVINGPNGNQVLLLTGVEQPYRVIVEEMAEGALTSADGTILYSNKCLSEFLLTPIEKIVGSSLADYVDPADMEKLKECLQSAVVGPRRAEFRLFRPNGGNLIVEASITPLMIGDIEGFCLIIQDKTREKKILSDLQVEVRERQQAQAEYKKWSRVAEASPIGILILDSEGKRIQMVNPTFRTMFQWSKDAPIDDDATKLWGHHYHGDMREKLANAIHGGSEQHEIECVRKDGTEFAAELTETAIRGSGGTLLFIACHIQDITIRKEAETILAQSKEELEKMVAERTRELEKQARLLFESNADLEQFAFVASHDLQEPLRTVASYGQLLESTQAGKLDEKGIRYIKLIAEGVCRMRRFVGDLLMYSRAGREVKMEQLNTKELIEHVLHDLQGAIKDKEAIIDLADVPPVTGDPSQLSQLFQNLISNALKFSDKSVRVSISGEQVDGAVRFRIQDSGIGIEKAFLEKIFEPFKRLYSRAEYDGSGIGLAVARKIVERHGGRIWVDAEVGKGATFYFTLHDRGGAGDSSFSSNFPPSNGNVSQ